MGGKRKNMNFRAQKKKKRYYPLPLTRVGVCFALSISHHKEIFLNKKWELKVSGKCFHPHALSSDNEHNEEKVFFAAVVGRGKFELSRKLGGLEKKEKVGKRLTTPLFLRQRSILPRFYFASPPLPIAPRNKRTKRGEFPNDDQRRGPRKNKKKIKKNI